jgi:oligopeptidase A
MQHEMQASDLRDNPLYRFSWPPRFDAVEPRHVVPAITALLEESEAAFTEAEASVVPTWEGAVEAIDATGHALADAWNVVSHLMGVRNTPELRSAHEEMLPGLVAFGLRANQSRPVFEALSALHASDDFERLEPAMQRVVEQRVLDMRLGGVGLDGPDRDRFNAIANELSNLANAFSNNVLDATMGWELVVTDSARLDGLSRTERSLLAQSWAGSTGGNADPDGGPWRLSLDMPSVRPILESCRDRSLRETVYRAFVTRASEGSSDNGPLVPRILTLRAEMASLLGYANYAELSTARKMADVDSARALLESLREACWEPGRQDAEALAEFAAEHGLDGPLAPWDVRFYRMKMREERFGFTSDDLRPYFPLERVLDGLFELVERVFGIRIVGADGEVPVWHETVRYFRVLEGQDTVAAFYLDPFARPADKRGGAWMSDARTPRRSDPDSGYPIAHLVCNGTPPIGDAPSLMDFDEVVTLFHEFGHGLHHMLTRVDIESVAGTNGVEWDAVELPSQFMENWCYHRDTVRRMTAHVDTGEPLPDTLFDKIVAARNFFAGTDFLRQLQFGLLDLELHTTFDASKDDPIEAQRRVMARTSHMPTVPEDRSLFAFAHIFAGGYAAGYYSYKWAEVLSADAFAAFEEAGLEDVEQLAEVGARFRDTVLALGGSVPPAEVFRAFRGRDPEIDALLRSYGLGA